MRTPLPRHSGHSWHRHMFLYQNNPNPNVPKDRNITYGKIVCDYKPHKKEKERVRLTVGGDRLDYSGSVATSKADITTFKILINSTLSTEEAAMMMMDIKNYYIGTPLPRFEYMKMLLSRFPEEIVQKYNLNALAVDVWVYIEIRKGMYGLKQAGLLDNQLLQTCLAPFGYYPARHTPGLWLHKTRPISFTLIVDDFAVKYVSKQHAEHLRNALLQTYELTTDWTATVYSGMTLKWDYKNRTCDISMPAVLQTSKANFNMTPPSIHNILRQGTPRPSTEPIPNIQQKMKHRHSQPKNVSQSQKSRDLFCTTPEQSIRPF
jgi:hypothetical protein